jgi:hypothetical protein
MRWRGAVATLAVSALALALAPAAQALITGSQVTRPADPRYLIFDVNNPNTFAINGTTTGGNPATDHVDLRCYLGSGSVSNPVASNVPLASDGRFSVPNAELSTIESAICRLRAVPAGTTPSNLAPFDGPLIGGDPRQLYRFASGPNNGILYDFYFLGIQRQGDFDYDSLTSCGLTDGYLRNADLNRTTLTFYCNAWLAQFNDASNFAASTRSELRVDGRDAYGPDTAVEINPNASPGFPPLAFSVDVGATTGNVNIHETDRIVRCPDETYPPTTVSCPRFVPTHVIDERTIVQDHTGHLSMITDVFRPTDNHAHELDLRWQNDQHFTGSGAPFDSTTLAYRFPGQRRFKVHETGDVVDLPKRAPATIFVKQRGVEDGNTQSGRGAITYDRRAKNAKFTYVTTSQSDFELHQRATVRRDGAARFHFAYAHAYDQADVDSLARLAERRFG